MTFVIATELNAPTLAHVLDSIPYRNRGQRAECMVRYMLTGAIGRADNAPSWESGDVLNVQVKSFRASICHGTDLAAHIAQDAAEIYCYVTTDYKCYFMDPETWLSFATEHSTETRESKKNGGGSKLRLNYESKQFRADLEALALAA